MKKRLLGITALLAVICCLAGCQKKDPLPGEQEGFDPGEEYLSIWVHSIEDTEEGQVYRQAVDRFNEAFDGKYFADIEFVPRNDSGGGYSDKINASVMSGMLPDVLTVDGPNIAAYAANGIIQPLAELTEEERSTYLESILEQGTYDGQLYALGVMESSVGLYYNKDILDAAGIEVPTADHPWTWSEFMDILEKLKPMMDELGGYPLDMTFPVGETSIYYYAPFVWSNGSDMVSEDGMTVDGIFNSPENVETMELFRSIVEHGYMSEAPIDKLFESGRAAFKFDGAWEVNTAYTSYPDLHLGVAPYIVSDDWDGGRYTPTGSWAFAASTDAEDIEAATELVKYMSGVESGVQMWEQTKNFPSTYAAFEQIDVFRTDENYRALYEQLSQYGHPRPKTPVYPQVSTSFQQALESIALSGKDAQTELDKAVERIDAKLERYTRTS
ncbi:MAG: sugar ABC transporter substrate-binding protein [Butyricicoccus sp.]|nr:sugar ABC transporter substrate-binding protein [Butyricicoccus sp.]